MKTEKELKLEMYQKYIDALDAYITSLGNSGSVQAFDSNPGKPPPPPPPPPGG